MEKGIAASMSIAVLIATYNSSRFLAETLASLSGQQRKPEEVVVVDDGSTDDTLAIARDWGKAQPFQVTLLQNRYPRDSESSPGPAGCRTTGLEQASADLIALLDHDDLMLPTHLQKTEQALRCHPELELVFGDALEFRSDSQTEQSFLEGKSIERLRFRAGKDGLRILDEPILPTMVAGSYIPTAANLWRRDTAIRSGGFERRAGGADDMVFFTRLSRRGGVGYFRTPIARRRLHPNNLSHCRYLLDRMKDHIRALELLCGESTELRLADSDRYLMNELILRLTDELLYHASRKGAAIYFDNLEIVDRSPQTRDMARAFVFSLRNLMDATRG